MKSTRTIGRAALALVVYAASFGDQASAQTTFLDDWRPLPAHVGQTRAPLANQSTRLFIDVVASGLDGAFGLAILPSGQILVSETQGNLRVIERDGTVSAPLGGMPRIMPFSQNGAQGLHDIALHPDFERNRLVYFVYSAPPRGVSAAVALGDIEGEPRRLIGRARLSPAADRLSNVEELFEVAARRIVFANDGTLFITTVAAGDAERHLAQDMLSLAGKVLRINADGSIPDDNPFVGNDAVHPAVYSSGHRDLSGAAIHPRTGELWTIEHGPRGGDELNVIRPGRNYGWPVITYGRNYDETPVGEGLTALDGMEQPLYFWVPSIAPSSLMFYSGDLFPEWHGNALIGTLSGEHMARLELVGERVAAEERLLVGREQRIRSVAQGPDGAVYLLASGVREPSDLLRLRPKPPPNLFGN